MTSGGRVLREISCSSRREKCTRGSSGSVSESRGFAWEPDSKLFEIWFWILGRGKTTAVSVSPAVKSASLFMGARLETNELWESKKRVLWRQNLYKQIKTRITLNNMVVIKNTKSNLGSQDLSGWVGHVYSDGIHWLVYPTKYVWVKLKWGHRGSGNLEETWDNVYARYPRIKTTYVSVFCCMKIAFRSGSCQGAYQTRGTRSYPWNSWGMPGLVAERLQKYQKWCAFGLLPPLIDASVKY